MLCMACLKCKLYYPKNSKISVLKNSVDRIFWSLMNTFDVVINIISSNAIEYILSEFENLQYPYWVTY